MTTIWPVAIDTDDSDGVYLFATEQDAQHFASGWTQKTGRKATLHGEQSVADRDQTERLIKAVTS